MSEAGNINDLDYPHHTVQVLNGILQTKTDRTSGRYDNATLMNDSSTFDISASLVRTLREARHVTVLTGAGVSAESGLATFRDAMTGLWAHYNPEDLASPAAFTRNPRLVWDWYAWRRERAAQAQPNLAHLALVELERCVPHFTLITQNVDGLHQRAGSTGVIELHGNLSRTKCSLEGRIIESWPPTNERPPRCPACGALLRPDVVWFGEMLPSGALAAAVDAATHCDLFFSIGTSGVVEPAASLPRIAAQHGAVVAYLNLDVTPHASSMRYQINGPAGQVLPTLVRTAWPEIGRHNGRQNG